MATSKHPVKRKMSPVFIQPARPARGQRRTEDKPEEPGDLVTMRFRLSWTVPAVLGILLFILGLLTGHSHGFPAYDCHNRSNHVEVFSLLEPASCHAASTDLRVERILPAEIIQISNTRTIPVLRCLAVVTEVLQYCRHSSVAGVMRFLKFRETATVESQSCRDAFDNKGRLEVGSRVYSAVIGSTSSHQDYLAGSLDDSNNCKVRQFQDTKTKKTYGYQVASSVVEVTLFREQGQVHDIEGTIKLTDNIITKVADESVRDALRGTYMWKHERLSCPDTISQIYRGPLKFYVNSLDTNLKGGLAVLEHEDQLAGLEITTSFSLCFTAMWMWMTHIRDVVIVLHNDNFTAVAKNGFDPGSASEATSLEFQLSFLHIKKALSQKEMLRQVRLAICENRRKVLLSRLEAIAGTDNPYSLTNVLGRGVMLT